MKKIVLILIFNFIVLPCFATERVVNLVVDYKTVNFAGKPVKALAINNQIPGPTLHFKENERVKLHVVNHLDQDTALHWHGLLVPWQMDGVEGLSQRGIPPQGSFDYEFTVKQAGTYWYHSHAGLQEQQGLYGGIIIDPAKASSYRVNQDYVVVLSDWNNSKPEKTLSNLKRDGDYYAPRFPLQASLEKFIHDYSKANSEERKTVLSDYKMMQQTRMSIYDLSDVAYDAFLLNGHTSKQPWTAAVKVGDLVRLRFIGAGADTIFRVKIPGVKLRVIQAQGNEIKPVEMDDFTIAPGETYDVLVKIKKDQPYFIYAESRSTQGAALGALVTSSQQKIADTVIEPFPEQEPVTREMFQFMGHEHQHMKMLMPLEPSRHQDSFEPPSSSTASTSPGTKYEDFKATRVSNDPNKPIAAVIPMELYGYMGRYIWFINGQPEYNAKPIIFEPNKRYRLVFTNNSMMHHPMHLHGHWFILRNGHGAHDPLLHTLDIPPGATMVADVDTDASGQWFFHCHLLYHMISGMARDFQYSTLLELSQGEIKPENVVKDTAYYNRPIVRVDEARPLDEKLIHHPMPHAPGLWLSSYIEAGEDPIHNTQLVTYKGLYGPDFHKLELFMNDAEVDEGSVEFADLDVFYWQQVSQFWALKGGVNYMYRPAQVPYWQPGVGVEGLMPYFIDASLRSYYYSGSAKLDLEFSRDTQITNNFFIRLGARSILASKTVRRAAIGSGLNEMRYVFRPYYRLVPGINVFVEYEHQQDYGVFRALQTQSGVQGVENTVTLGLSVLF